MKKKRKIIWQVFPWYLLIALVALFSVIWYTRSNVYRFFLQQTQRDLKIQAQLLETAFTRHLASGQTHAIDHLCKAFGLNAPTRITLILPDGRVAGDSEYNPEEMESHLTRPEVAAAFQNDFASATRHSQTLGREMMYVAITLKDDNRLLGILRTAIPLTDVRQTLNRIQVKITIGGLLISLATTLVSLYVSRRITRPLEIMTDGARQFAKGNLAHRLHTPGSYELSGLADALNVMAQQLEDRMETVLSQRNEYEAVLSSMLEGVIAIDSEDHLLSINQAAIDILKIEDQAVKGRTVQELVRHREFFEYVSQALSGRRMADKDLELHEEQARIINVRSTPLIDAKNVHIGLLIVLNDVTKVRHLENMRKDFVANASHEIKTPLTAIKGFVETMRETLPTAADDANHFIEIIVRHVNRLNAIIDDLLSLSRIEQIDAKENVRLENRRLKNLIENAAGAVQHKADLKHIRFDVHCSSTLVVQVDSSIFEQALINLIDNAVAYSPEDSSVKIRVQLEARHVTIQVEDHGCGIAQKHLPRLFERFYRVDKARSRKIGGTGLGLAIVKHIMHAHGGSVAVESELGIGSTFSLYLPAKLVFQHTDKDDTIDPLVK